MIARIARQQPNILSVLAKRRTFVSITNFAFSGLARQRHTTNNDEMAIKHNQQIPVGYTSNTIVADKQY